MFNWLNLWSYFLNAISLYPSTLEQLYLGAMQVRQLTALLYSTSRHTDQDVPIIGSVNAQHSCLSGMIQMAPDLEIAFSKLGDWTLTQWLNFWYYSIWSAVKDSTCIDCSGLPCCCAGTWLNFKFNFQSKERELRLHRAEMCGNNC